VGHDVSDRSSGERRSQVAVKEATDVQEVLHDERLIEVVLRSDLLDDARRRRVITEQRCDGISGECEHHVVDEEGRTEEDGDELQQAPAGIPEHQRSPAGEVRGIIAFILRFFHHNVRGGRPPRTSFVEDSTIRD